MLCKKPFCRKPTGEIKALAKINPDMRLAVTPFPCGQCLNCRINISMIWSSRIKMERDLHKESIFVTLTYNDDHLPIINGANTLDPNDFTNFLKKYRSYINKKRKIRYMGVGEYGKISSRPHYHLIIFNSKLGDEYHIQKAWTKNKQEMGFFTTSDLTDGRINYVAGYIVDKLIERGQIDVRVHPPFMRSSKGKTSSICSKFKGGIGAGYAYYCGYQISQNKWVEPEDITKMVYGSKRLPIGRYLTSIIANESGVDEDVFKLKNEVYYEDLLDHIYEQVQLDVEKPEKSPYKKEGKAIPYYDSIRARFKQRRLVQAKRNKIYTSRNHI